MAMVKKEIPLALVSGSAHRLGRTFALGLARQGFAILLHYHSSASLAVTTAEEVRALGVPAYPIQADLTAPEQILTIFTVLDSLPHRLQVLVNSASIMLRQDVRTLSASGWDAAMALNLRAPFLLAQQAAARMGTGGLIVNVTDVGAGKAWSAFPAYTVSKAALESLTRVLAKAYAPRVRVNAIAPGLVLRGEAVSEEEWDQMIRRLPLQRPAKEQALAAVLDFLVKNESVTGQTIAVDGGYSLI
jgi:pteridine reductase